MPTIEHEEAREVLRPSMAGKITEWRHRAKQLRKGELEPWRSQAERDAAAGRIEQCADELEEAMA